MNKSLIIILVLAVAIQVTLTAPQNSEESALKQTERFKLFEFAYDNLRTTVWPVEVYPKMTEYMTKIKEWCDNDGALKKLTTYDELQEEIGHCLSLLKELTEDPANCENQMALSESHEKIRNLFDSVENEKIRHDFSKKYINFALQMRLVMRNSYENFYTLLATEVDSYLNDLDGVEATAIIQWEKKFNLEDDFVNKQMLVMEFMRLFPEERPILEAKCKIQYKNNL